MWSALPISYSGYVESSSVPGYWGYSESSGVPVGLRPKLTPL